jgi:hypothetical protein
MPPRTRRTSSNHPSAAETSTSKPVLIPVVEIPASSSSANSNISRGVDMAVSKNNANKQTTVSSGSAASSRTVTPEKLQSVNANAQKKFNAGSTPVKFYVGASLAE